MSPDDASAARLDALRRRWEADPSSRIYLQLAEEYRRADRPAEALEVLKKGLEAHPNQVSALVALGRTLVALDRPGEAVEALDKAMSIDGTNPMAQKVAVIANLELGDRDQARRHLDLYKLINSSDAEIAELEARVDAPASEPPPLPGSGAATEEAAADEPGESDEAPAPAAEASWSPTAAWPELPRSEAGLEPIGEDEEAAADAVTEPQSVAMPTTTAPPPTGDDRDPEPFAHLYAGDQRRRYLTALASEGIFTVDEEAPAGDEQEPQAATLPEGEERPTVTLGRLYLEQGHHQEAERIFAAVLARDPDNGAAQLGMAQARASLALGGPDEERVSAVEADDAPTVDLGADEGWVLEQAAEADEEAEPPAAEEPVAGAAPAPSEEPTLVLDPPDEAPEPAIPNRPRPYEITARQLLAGSDPESPRKVALMRAYLDRIVARRAEGEQAPDVS